MTDLREGVSLPVQNKRCCVALVLSIVGLSFSLVGVGGIFSLVALLLCLTEHRRGKLPSMGIVALVLALFGLAVSVIVTVYMGAVFLLLEGYTDTPEFSALLESLLERAGGSAP